MPKEVLRKQLPKITKGPSGWNTKCCCCGERIRQCETVITVVGVQGERYCKSCEKYAAMNNPVGVAA
tara:strand:+ start:724 stop:924 length:201 start_codon:yes stop_codon:yes gene_type:complete